MFHCESCLSEIYFSCVLYSIRVHNNQIKRVLLCENCEKSVNPDADPEAQSKINSEAGVPNTNHSEAENTKVNSEAEDILFEDFEFI